jgi:hypothetical protein
MNTFQADVVALIRDVGIQRLGLWDGCPCSSFSVRNVDVDISCGRGRVIGVWISSKSCDYMDTENLKPIGEEVARQLEEESSRGPFPIHYREWDAIKDARPKEL